MKILSGSDLASYIKQRQLRQFRAVKHGREGRPARLAIVQTIDDPVIDTYVRLKQAYADDVEATVDVHRIDQAEALDRIAALNDDPEVDGIIVQLPLANQSQREEILTAVAPGKDVDGLNPETDFTPATPMAILWLLAGYNIEPSNYKVLVIGLGRLVGKPLVAELQAAGVEPTIADSTTTDLPAMVGANDLIITATGQPGLITADMLSDRQIVIDAGVASDKGVNRGDVADDVYEQAAIKAISAQKGGVGPLTVCALFDNLIRSALRS